MSAQVQKLPKGWTLGTFKETATVFHGNSIPRNKKREVFLVSREGSSYIATKDISHDHQLAYNNGVLIPYSESHNFTIAPEDCVFVCSEGGSAGKKVAYNEQRTYFGNKLYAIVPDHGIQGKYLFYYCISYAFYHAFVALQKGLIGGVSLKKFRRIEYPIAPVNEQKKIVSKLDKIQVHSTFINEEIKSISFLTERFCQSVLISAFRGELTTQWRKDNPNTEPASIMLEQMRKEHKSKWVAKAAEKVRARSEARAKTRGKEWSEQDNKEALQAAVSSVKKIYKAPSKIDTTHLPELPNGWVWARLDELCCEGPQGGYSGKSADIAAGTLTMKLSATTTGTMIITSKTTKHLFETLPKDSSYFLQNGDLLIQRANSLQHLGAAAIFEGHDTPIIFPDLMMRVRTSRKEITHLLWRYCNSLGCRIFFRKNATGSAGNMPKINATVLKSTPVPLPPIDEITEMLSSINRSLQYASQISTKVEELTRLHQTLTQSILAKAFRGELVPQDPNEETAESLLASIKHRRDTR